MVCIVACGQGIGIWLVPRKERRMKMRNQETDECVTIFIKTALVVLGITHNIWITAIYMLWVIGEEAWAQWTQN